MKHRFFSVKTKYRQIRSSFSLNNNRLYKEISGLEPISVRNPVPVTWHHAEGFSVYDNVDNKWIDLTSGIFVANAGHANPTIKNAIKKQLDSNLVFSYNYPTEIRQRLLKKIFSLSPKHFNCAALLNSGSEAIDLAYKLMKLYGKSRNKKYIVTFADNYHGRGLSNDLISGSKNKARNWSGITDRDIIFLDFPYESSASFDPEKLPPGDQIAAFMLETFQGWGAWFYPDKFLKDLYSFARRHKALICFDEMQAGFYRLGKIYGYMTYGNYVKPDIICLGKGITSSLPLSLVLSRKEIMNLDEKADMHGTHSGNPVCCAAALANLDFLYENAGKFKKTSAVFEREIKKLGRFKTIRGINVRGMIAGLILDDTKTATAIVKKCVTNGILPVCTNRNSIKIAPPLTISMPALTEALSVFAEIIKKHEQ